ncbi:MAG TPA: glycosyltransferase family 4 protein [Afifellaceae bacterium]|nr:glycosyltransferase family 4 protein [Afifellaceae bacterium]
MTADSVGGVWSYALELARQLGRRGIEVTLFTMGGKPDAEQVREAARIPSLSLIGTDLKLEWMAGSADDLELAGEMLLELETEQQPDIVHLNNYWHASLPFQAPLLVAAHSCVPTWWRACRQGPLPQDWEAYREAVGAAVAAADLVVAPSRSYLDAFVAAHGWPRACRVIHNGRDPGRYRPRPKRPYVLAAGRLWDEGKNVAALCRAAEGLGHPVLVAGDADGPDGAQIDRPANVAWLGRIPGDRLAEHMGEAAVFAAPARYEPFGLGVLEAALSGCALVLGDIPTFRELWGGAATFVAPDDDGELRRALRALLDEPARAAELGRRARRRALRYGADQMGEASLAAYRGLLAAPGRRLTVAAAGQGAVA